MTRKALLPIVLLLAASTAFAGRTRAVAVGGDSQAEARIAGATVSGIVSSVSGNLIRLADGLVTVDATGAQIVVDRGKSGTIASIEPGMLVFAMLKSTSAPLVASMITATSLPDATLTGPVESVSLTNNSFNLLGRTIFVDADTSFGGFKRDGHPTLADLLPNEVVVATVDATGGRLVATSVLVVSFTPPTVKATHGKVKSIAPDSWVITREREGDLTLVVNAQTKIAGAPKVGDEVEVIYSIDSANANIAISIIRFERPTPPNQTTLFHGRVKTITADAWTIDDTRVLINAQTKIVGSPKVGDNVEVLAQKNDAGALVAILILRLP